MFKKLTSWIMVCALILFTPTSGFAVGSGAFENASFSAKQLGMGGAGVASPSEPASISYNPAGILDLPGVQVQSNSTFLSSMTFYDSETQGSTRSSGTLNIIPTAYVTINPGKILNDRLAIGVGTDSPFGLSNKYDANHPIVRYIGHVNYMKMFTVKPVMALKITDWLSIGAGPMYYRVFKFGQILQYPNASLVPGSPDGQARLNMKGNAWGWHLGILAKPHKKHRLGFYFRSPVNTDLKGRLNVEDSVLSGNFEVAATSKLHLPLNMTWAYAFIPTERTELNVDFSFTRWSVHDKGHITTDPISPATAVSGFDDNLITGLANTSGLTTAADKDYRNGFGLHFGASHEFTDKFTLRGGTWYFWTPVPKTSFTPVVADSNRIAFSLGTGYNLTDNIVVDLSYFVMFFLRRRINNQISETLGTSVDGTYRSFLQAFTLSLTYKWDTLFNGKPEPEPEVVFQEVPEVV